jgi:hypothetical protein
MRAYTIKHKGATILNNFIFEKKITIESANKDTFYIGYLFYRKRHAKAYLDTFKYKEFFEIVGVNIDKVKGDNRKRKI